MMCLFHLPVSCTTSLGVREIQKKDKIIWRLQLIIIREGKIVAVRFDVTVGGKIFVVPNNDELK